MMITFGFLRDRRQLLHVLEQRGMRLASVHRRSGLSRVGAGGGDSLHPLPETSHVSSLRRLRMTLWEEGIVLHDEVPTTIVIVLVLQEERKMAHRMHTAIVEKDLCIPERRQGERKGREDG